MLYLGTLDDKVTDYPWTGERRGLGFNKVLLQNFLFGEDAYVNDGYILQSEEALLGIRREGTDSLLEVLADAGHIKVLCRTDPKDMAKKMVDGGVSSHARFANDPIVQEAMTSWSNTLHKTGAYQQWPSVDIGQGFYKIVKMLKAAPEDSLSFDELPVALYRRISTEFLVAFEYEPKAARDKWEKIAQKHCEKLLDSERSKLALREIMNLANEIYHFNFAGILSGEQSEAVSAETRLNQLFFWMMANSFNEAEAFDEENLPGDLPMPTLPWHDLQVDISDGNKVVRPFVEPGRPETEARDAFFKARRAIFDDPQNGHLQDEFRAAVANYDRVLAKHFGVGKSSAEMTFETFVDPVARVLNEKLPEEVGEWAEAVEQALPGEAIAAGVGGLLQVTSHVATYVDHYAPALKRRLRKVGRISYEGLMESGPNSFAEQMSITARKSKDVISATELNNKLCKSFYSSLDRFG